MRKAFLWVILGLSTQLYAAKFKRIKIEEVRHKDLKAMLKDWNSTTAGIDNTDVSAVQILSKKESEPSINTIKQVLWRSSDIAEIEVQRVELSPENLEEKINKAVDELIEASTYLPVEMEKYEINRLSKRLKKRLNQALINNKHLSLYVGGIDYANSEASSIHISILDESNPEAVQIVSLVGGYSE